MRFKKTTAALLAAILAVSVPLAVAVNNAVSVTASAADVHTEGDWRYGDRYDGEVYLIKYTGTDADVVVPSTLGGKKVTDLGFATFEDCTSLKSVVIPNGVTEILSKTFRNCTSLISVTIPDSVTVIDTASFNTCSSLETITVGENNANFSSIDGVLFDDRLALILYPKGKKDKSYTLPDCSVGILGWFYECANLTSITIHDNAGPIDPGNFVRCSSLETIIVGENNEYVSSIDGVVFNKEGTELVYYPSGKKDKSYTIPDGVTEIGQNAFNHCTSLTSLTIPDDVKLMWDCTFSGCNSLETITVGDNNPSYLSIDGVLFDDEKNWLHRYPAGKKDKSYTIPNDVTIIDTSAFEDCTSLTSVTIPDSVTGMNHSAFKNCTSLTSVIVPDGMTSITQSAFENCTSLTSVTIPNSVTQIYPDVFYGCTSLETVYYSGTKAEWEAMEIEPWTNSGTYFDENNNKVDYGLKIAEIICTDGIINGREDDTSEPTTSDPTTSEPTTSEPATSDPTASEPTTSEPTTSEPTTSVPTESTVTPGETDPASEPDSGTDEQTVLEATLKNVDSENGIEGEALDKLLFGDSGWTWDQVEKIEFSSDNLFSVQYKNDNGDWVKLGDEPTARAAADGEWNTAWTLDPSEMGKDKYAKVISKDGIIDVTAKIYIKSGAEKPSNVNSGDDQQPTGIALAIAPAVLAAGAVIAVSKKRK